MSEPVRVLPMGDRALLAEVDSLDAARRLHARLEASRLPGVVDLVPAARTVLVRVVPGALGAARAWVAHQATTDAASADASADTVELDVVYDGPDLADAAAVLGVGPDELVRRHASAAWTVAFTGFAPGFGYLVSPDWPFSVPRLDSPRTRVPAGAVGLADGFAGAYPRATPGGWRLIGTTDAVLFDPDAASPALLAPGTRVRFREVARAAPSAAPSAAPAAGEASSTSSGRAPVRVGADASSTPALEAAATHPGNGSRSAGEASSDGAATPLSGSRRLRVVEPGLLATLQDLGRPAGASLGVAPSGALDRAALRTANRLVGNPERAAAVEITMGGFRAVADADAWFAVAGAWGPIRLDGRALDPYQAHPWSAGAELHVDWFAHGARAYLAVRGGLDGRLVLGSRSSDLLAGLGPEPLRAGAEVGIRDDAATPIPVVELAPWGAPRDDELVVELDPGPRADWFAASARRMLYESAWTVSNDADRVGVRLDGPALERVRDRELPSEGMVPGALQVPPSGRPTILLADGPVTGGYPVIAVATDAALDALAQARPGTRLRFRHAHPAG